MENQPPTQSTNRPGKGVNSGPNPLQFVTLGGEMAGTAFLGYLVDLYFKSVPVFTVVGAVAGIVSSGMHLYRMLAQSGPKTKTGNRPNSKP